MKYGKFISTWLLIGLALLAQTTFAAVSTPTKTTDGEPLVYGHGFNHHSTRFDAERRYLVALPERYHADRRAYPVLYVIDADFQFMHVSAAVSNLARMGKIPPMIVVGVATQGQADYLYSTTWVSQTEGADFGGADRMQGYLKDELLPLINKQYRTSGRNALAGYSLGGLFTLYSMLSIDTPFDAFLAMSPSAWYDDASASSNIRQRFGDYLQRLGKRNQTPPPLFLSLANEQGMGVSELYANLSQEGPKDWQLDFQHFPDETHYSTAMPSILAGLNFLAPGYYKDLDPLLEMKDYRDVLAHFAAKRGQWAGFRFGWLQSYTLAKYLFISKQDGQMAELLAKARTEFPESHTELCIGFAKALIKKQQAQKAQEILELATDEGRESADWQQQLSLSLAAQGKPQLAQQHHRRALELAEQQGLASWEWWELAP
jgi:uncharacterized protein